MYMYCVTSLYINKQHLKLANKKTQTDKDLVYNIKWNIEQRENIQQTFSYE